MRMSFSDFKKKWNVKVKDPWYSSVIKIYSGGELVGEFDYTRRPYMYWVSTECIKEFIDDFLKVFAERAG